MVTVHPAAQDLELTNSRSIQIALSNISVRF